MSNCFDLTFYVRKCEEIYPPDVNEFVYITDDTYTTKQVLRMEYLILKVLQFEVAVPTSYSFILYFSGALYLTDKVKYLAMVSMCTERRNIN